MLTFFAPNPFMMSHAPSPGQDRLFMMRLLLIVGILFAWRAMVQSTSNLPLHYDEAQYYGWSLAPAFGYYSKPPMIAWAIAGARTLCGEAEACIRLPALIAFALSSLLTALSARRLAGDQAGLWSGGIFATMPLTSFYAGVATTDSLMLLAWSAALYGFIRATQGGKPSWWLFTGVAAGAGLLSKYTMGVFGLSAMLWLVVDRASRHHLRSPWLWAGAALALLMLSPNLLWQAQHGFATVEHTVEISQAGGGQGFGLRGLLEFLAAQPLLAGPGFAVATVALLAQRRHRQLDPSQRRAIHLALSFCWPMLLIISLQALMTRAFANWAAAAWVGGTIACGVLLAALQQRRWFVTGLVLNVALLLAISFGPAVIGALRQHLPDLRNPYDQLRGWQGLGEQVREELLRNPGMRVLGVERRVLSELIYYARPMAHPVYVWNPERRRNDHYRLLYDVASQPAGQSYLFVAESGSYSAQDLARDFERVEPVLILRQPVGRNPSARFELLRVSGFRGRS